MAITSLVSNVVQCIIVVNTYNLKIQRLLQLHETTLFCMKYVNIVE